MEDQLYYNKCRIRFEANIITCSYDTQWGMKNWQLTLDDNDIYYKVNGKQKCSFKIKDIQEFQFEMGNGVNGRAYEDFPAAIAVYYGDVDHLIPGQTDQAIS